MSKQTLSDATSPHSQHREKKENTETVRSGSSASGPKTGGEGNFSWTLAGGFSKLSVFLVILGKTDANKTPWAV